MKLLAALIFFTRLPFWRLANVPSEHFKRVVDYWPFVGWLTGGIMCLTLWAASQAFTLPVAIVLVLASRLLITGALHEDGLADFCDGFGGGTSRERILTIMKDSHIGTYGVIGLIFYFGLMYNLLAALPLPLAYATIIAADTWSKCCASWIVNVLPYARREEEAKAKVVYEPMSPCIKTIGLFAGMLPLAVFLPMPYWWAIPAPIAVAFLLFRLMRKKIQGYTGDCCGATFLLCELSFYLIINLIHNLS